MTAQAEVFDENYVIDTVIEFVIESAAESRSVLHLVYLISPYS